jgi:cell wall-associated NlpC family hydrolase
MNWLQKSEDVLDFSQFSLGRLPHQARTGKERRVLVRRLVAGLLGSVLAVGALVAPPAVGDPSTVAEAEAEYAQYQEEASQAEQAYHDLHDKLTAAQAEADAIAATIADQEAEIATLRSQVKQILLTEYQTRGLSTTASLLVGDSTEEVLAQAMVAHQLADQSSDTIQRFQLELGSLADNQARLDRITADMAADDARLDELQQEAKAKADQAAAVLARLEAEAARQAEAAARAAQATTGAAATGGTAWVASTTAPAYTGDGSLASIVVQFGLSKVGGPYVWGGNGPSGYDCSGLTRAAYLEVGISLPHNAAAQMEYGTPVSTDALQPGDLLFYYSPVGHVAIYIGGGQIVHASTYGVGIVVGNAFSMSLTGARRYV